MALALYRKYRPAKFAEVVGQEHVTDPLRTALASGRINHAYLFSGPRGCGKTSSARILARSLNCEQGPTPEPCGVCGSCVSLAPGGPGNIDVTELDAASHGGVDDTRELRDRAFFAPAESRYRVFIVDEAHMITTQGFNALLKIVEEPPEHLVFVFATTEPEKVLPTIRSRTHHYPFRLIPPGTLRKLLERICAEEGVAVAPAVYPLVIRAGGGSARDSLSVLDQLVSGAGPEGVTYERAVALLGVTDVSLIDDVVDALAAGDRAAVFEAVDRLVEAGHDPRRFATDLLQRLRDLTLLQAVPEAVGRGIVEAADDEVRRMVEQSAKFGAATLTRYGEILHTGLTEMRGATAPRLLLELLCARMLLPAATTAEPGLLERLERLERRSAIASGPPAPGEATDDTGHGRQFDRPSTRAADAPSTSGRSGSDERGGEPPVAQPAGAAEHGGLIVVTRESGVAAAAAAQGSSGSVAGPGGQGSAGAGRDEPAAAAGRDVSEAMAAGRSGPVAGAGRVDPTAAAAGHGGPGAAASGLSGPEVVAGAGRDDPIAAAAGPGGSGVTASARSGSGVADARPAAPAATAAERRGPEVGVAGGGAGDLAAARRGGPEGGAAPGIGRDVRVGGSTGQPPSGAPNGPAGDDQLPPDSPATVETDGSAPERSDQRAAAAVGATDVRRVWQEIQDAVKQRKKRTAALLVSATVRAVEHDTLVLSIGTAPLARLLAEQSNTDVIAEALHAVLGVRWRVRCEHGDAPVPPPSARGAAEPRSAANSPAPAPARHRPSDAASATGAADGAAADGAAADGVAADGVAADGVAADGVAADGETAAGATAAGSTAAGGGSAGAGPSSGGGVAENGADGSGAGSRPGDARGGLAEGSGASGRAEGSAPAADSGRGALGSGPGVGGSMTEGASGTASGSAEHAGAAPSGPPSAAEPVPSGSVESVAASPSPSVESAGGAPSTGGGATSGSGAPVGPAASAIPGDGAAGTAGVVGGGSDVGPAATRLDRSAAAGGDGASPGGPPSPGAPVRQPSSDQPPSGGVASGGTSGGGAAVAATATVGGAPVTAAPGGAAAGSARPGRAGAAGRPQFQRPSTRAGVRPAVVDEVVPLPPEPADEDAPPDDEEAMLAELDAGTDGQAAGEQVPVVSDPEAAAIALLTTQLGARAITPR